MNKDIFFIILLMALITGLVVGFFIAKEKYEGQYECVNANLINASSIIEDGEWNVMYVTMPQEYFNIEEPIDGKIVYPKYIVINLRGKTVIDVIETFMHEMAHLYGYLDAKHFIIKDSDSNWDEYTDKIGENNAPKITAVI